MHVPIPFGRSWIVVNYCPRMKINIIIIIITLLVSSDLLEEEGIFLQYLVYHIPYHLFGLPIEKVSFNIEGSELKLTHVQFPKHS